MYEQPDMQPTMPNATKTIEVFRSGRHTAMSGDVLSFSESDLQASVAAYDPDVFEAPLVVGHPKVNAPAYGWVRSLSASNGLMSAEPHQVNPDFAEMVSAGSFKKISASFYSPDSKQNPVPGVYYLRHVGFLGAQAPAVKGLKSAEFADAEDDIVTIEFGESDSSWLWSLGRTMRGLREWLIEKFDADTADRVVPLYAAADMERAAENAMKKSVSPSFSEPTQKEISPVDPKKDQAQAADFAEREQKISDREKALQDREAAIKASEEKTRRADVTSFAEQLVDEGRVLPKDKAALVEFMDSEDGADAIEFSEGDATVKKSRSEWLRGFLKTLPVQVDFAERSAAEQEGAEHVDFAAPAGYTVNRDKLVVHNKALAYQAEHKCDYATAIASVGQ